MTPPQSRLTSNDDGAKTSSIAVSVFDKSALNSSSSIRERRSVSVLPLNSQYIAPWALCHASRAHMKHDYF
jgi:hypothetical protein